MKPWWERHPDRWRAELDALTDAGFDWTLEALDPDDALAHLSITVPPEVLATGDASLLRLEVLYPPAYPFFPPVVRDPDLALPLNRHRQPLYGTLCLTTTSSWSLGTTVASLLAQQLPRLLRTTNGEVEPGLEVPAPEPVAGQVPRQVLAYVLVDGAWRIPAALTQGRLLAGFVRANGDAPGAGVVKTVLGDGLRLETLSEPMGDLFPLNVIGRWTRWSGPLTDPPEVLWEAVASTLDPLVTVDQDAHPVRLDDGLELIGLLVPSEMAYRASGEQWFFLVRHRAEPQAPPRTELYHSALAGAGDYRARIPASAAWRGAGVLLVGCGALGGTLSLELARAGLDTLELLDGDLAEPATACRQLAPAFYAGLPKALALHQLLHELNPHTRVHAQVATLGDWRPTAVGQLDAHTSTLALVARNDLVVDAAADPAASRYLASLCMVTRTSFLHVSATAGVHGGVVALFPAGGDACWWCLLHHRHDGTVPFPPAATSPAGLVAPAGCDAPTFTGTGADLAGIAAHATRVALHHLATQGSAVAAGGAGIEAMRGNLFVARLRDHHGAPVPLHWRTRTLTRHRDCAMHDQPGPHPRDARPGEPPSDSATNQVTHHVPRPPR